VNEDLTNYRPDAAFQAVYQFSWYEFCDWYLELVKLKKGRLDVLCHALDTILKLLHPLAPMVTERIYSELPWADLGKLSLQKFPEAKAPGASHPDMTALKAAVEGIRNFRTENKISPKAPIPAFLETKNTALWQKLAPFITGLARLGDVKVNQAAPAGSAGKVATADFTFTLPLEGLVDKTAEKARLQNEIKKVRSDVEFSEKRLGNEGFVARAKPELVAQEKANLAAAKEKLAVLEEAIKKLG
jgi:valyl-tRNA synthetase